MARRRDAAALAIAAAIGVVLAGCAAPRPGLPAPPVAAAGDAALAAGLKAYDDGQYAQAEQRLAESLRLGLATPRDRANSSKHLAFIFCTSQRIADCEGAFRAARMADPSFALSRAEAGHPVWGPVWQRVQAR